MLLLLQQQHSVQRRGRPGGLQRTFLSALSLSAPDDGGGGLPLHQGGPEHGESLAGVPDVAVIHLEVEVEVTKIGKEPG